jgi:serine/threonine-protein kinase
MGGISRPARKFLTSIAAANPSRPRALRVEWPGPMSIPDDETRLREDGPQPVPALTPASGSGSAPTSSSGWLSSSGSIDHGRFPPGTFLGGRYRIVERLGRGGMGEVYRADDLKLGQPVALKFLREDVDTDAARLMQLHNEVRMARQVSHPNVCRVYDVADVEGHTFLSMEFVDGEDLASLLRRFGRFSVERSVELSRQICAGLAAAHERGVIHRDLKPANVMLDATGKVRITDFGLAGLTGEAPRAGTPAYMAPEQLAGQEVTAQSDIYALGLVLYEIFTGQRAVEAKNVAELLRKREEGIPPPSQIVRDLDPAIDRAILRCLEPDAADRPSSALAVAAALPGGDPLAAALAAGETPSPEMVAASGGTSAIKPFPAILGLLATWTLLFALAALSDRALVTSYTPFQKPPAVLADRANEIARSLGYTDAPVDTASGFTADGDFLRFVTERGDGAATRERLRTGRPSILLFWYRSSPRVMVPLGFEETITPANPPRTLTNMLTVMVDTEGRLVEFNAVPPQIETSPSGPRPGVDWGALFTAAALNQADFAPVAPNWTPPDYADERAAWEGPMPGWPEQRLRIEAAAHLGRPVYFQLVNPWTQPSRMTESSPSRARRWEQTIVVVVMIVVLVVAVFVARHNLRKGRGDRRGALRISAVMFATTLFAWLAGSTHVAVVNDEVLRLFTAIGDALFNAGLLWLLYLALEPYVRKLWPALLVSWSRLLSGDFLDARVGRDVLIGTLFGVAAVLVGRLDVEIRPLLGYPLLAPLVPSDVWLEGTRPMLAMISRLVFSALFNALWIIFGLVALNLIVRRAWVSAIVMTGFLLVTSAGDIAEAPPVWLGTVLALVVVGIIVWVVLRFGLLAAVTLFFVNFVLGSSALTIDASRWFFPSTLTALLLVASLAAYGFYSSRGGEPLLGRRLLE